MKILSICQPHFLPWLGYFNMIHNCSEFIFLDNIQYNRRSWQNRVHILDNHSSDKKKFISLSLLNYHQKKNIDDYKINENNLIYFKENIYQSYKDTKFYSNVSNFLVNKLEKNINNNLAQFNINLIKEVCHYLNIDLKYDTSSKINSNKKKEFLILDILKIKNADCYLANDGSFKYTDKNFFDKLKFQFHEYNHPYYQQTHKKRKIKFLSHLSVMDSLFNQDKKTEEIIKSFKVIF